MKFLLNLANPDYIYFCDKPLPKAKPSEIMKLSVKEMSERLGVGRNRPQFSWNSDIQIPDNWVLTKDDQDKLAELKSRMISPDNFVVCYLNETVGYGAFTSKKIKKGSICFYGGVLVTNDDRNQSCYLLQAGKTTSIDGIDYGSHSGLFLDLYPAEIPIETNSVQVARNNFVTLILQLSCGSIGYLEATTDIYPLMQCGLNYHRVFWNVLHQSEGVTKKFFDFQGEVIRDPNILRLLQYNMLSPEQVDNILGLSEPKTADEKIEAYIPYGKEFINFVKVMFRQNPDSPLIQEEKKFNESAKILPQRNLLQESNDDIVNAILIKYKTTKINADVAFRRAAGLGNTQDLKALNKHLKIDINKASENGMTALHWAYELERDDSIAYLLSLDSIATDKVDQYGRKPIDCKTQKRPSNTK